MKRVMQSMLCASLAVAVAGTSVASADIVNTYSFQSLTHNGTKADRACLSDQLVVTVQAPLTTSTYADFTFRNIIGLASDVAGIHFVGGACLDNLSLLGQSGATFGCNPVTLATPQLTPSIGDSSLSTGAFGASPSSGLHLLAGDGLDALADWMTVRITFNGRTLADVISAMATPDADSWFRIGLDVRSIGSAGACDTFGNGQHTSSAALVPLPAAVWQGLAMIGGVMALTAYRRFAARA